MAARSNGRGMHRIEDALKAILRVEESPGEEVSAGAIGRELELRPGRVAALTRELAAQGLVSYRPYRGVSLTSEGRGQALAMLRRHRLLELFLVEKLGMDWAEVHAEAERLEHAVSDRLAERLDAALGHPRVDPHGDPIPASDGELPLAALSDLLSCEERRDLTVSRIQDQSPDFLELVDRMGLRPGSPVRVEGRDREAEIVQLDVNQGDRVRLGNQAAGKILVQA